MVQWTEVWQAAGALRLSKVRGVGLSVEVPKKVSGGAWCRADHVSWFEAARGYTTVRAQKGDTAPV